jgi:hypothetical protein
LGECTGIILPTPAYFLEKKQPVGSNLKIAPVFHPFSRQKNPFCSAPMSCPKVKENPLQIKILQRVLKGWLAEEG